MDPSDIQHLIRTETAVIAKLLEINSAIELHHQKCNIAKTTGASLSAAGFVSTIAGVCLVPATAGVSLALTAGGIGASVVGGAASIGTDLASQSKYKRYAGELEAVLKKRLEVYHSIGRKIDGILAASIPENVRSEGSGGVDHARDSLAPLPPSRKKRRNRGKDEQVLSVPVKCLTKPKTTAICVTGLQTILTGYGSAGTLYDTSKILQFLYINRDIYSITNLSASLLAEKQLSSLLIGTVRQSLNKGLVELGARVGYNGLKIGARTMLFGLGAIGVAWDAYGLVKAWSSQPKMWKEVHKLILAIQYKIEQLELLVSE